MLDDININRVTQDDIDFVTKSLCQIYLKPAGEVGMSRSVNNNRNKRPNKYAKTKPWFNKECEKSRADYLKMKVEYRRDRSDDCRNRMELQSKKKKKKCYAKFQREFHSKLHNMKSTNPKEYWNILNNATNQKETPCKASTETFMEHFRNLNQRNHEDGQETFDPCNINHSINERIHQPFTKEEIMSQIKRAKNNKSSGEDQIINEFLKNCPHSVTKLIVKLFNIVLETGIIPTDWTIGLIQPIFKNKGSPEDPDNYRGITLLSCIGKLFTSVINSRLTSYLEGAGIIGR